VVMNVGETTPPAASSVTPFVRWTAYGIALLDKQEFTAAAAAFRRTAVEYPKLPDGCINEGIVLYTQGRYAEALKLFAEGGSLLSITGGEGLRNAGTACQENSTSPRTHAETMNPVNDGAFTFVNISKNFLHLTMYHA